MTTDPTAIRALSHAELFQKLSASTLDSIAALSRTHDYEEGEAVYRFGDDAVDVYVLVNGRVRFSLGVGNRPEGGHSVFTSRMVIGWAALVTDQPRRIATAECLEPTRLVEIPGQALLDLLEANPADGFIVMKRLAAMITRNFMS
jgi:CRP-like cAMP-binding protein